jgi:hypothetical protein
MKDNKKIKRYNMDVGFASDCGNIVTRRECSDGRYVLYSDAITEIKRLKDVIWKALEDGDLYILGTEVYSWEDNEEDL